MQLLMLIKDTVVWAEKLLKSMQLDSLRAWLYL